MATAEQVLVLFEFYNAFPVLEPGQQSQTYIPYNIIAPHEAQAMENHGQTLQRLAERGGLSWEEIFAVIKNKTWKELGWGPVSQKEAKARTQKAKEEVLCYIEMRCGARCECS